MSGLLVKAGDVWVDPLRVVYVDNDSGRCRIVMRIEDYGVRDVYAEDVRVDEVANIINGAREQRMGTT
jgi:hypothetical protein